MRFMFKDELQQHKDINRDVWTMSQYFAVGSRASDPVVWC